MHKKSSQVVTEQNPTLYFRCPSFSANHLLNVAPNIKVCFSSPVLAPTEAWVPSGLYLKVWEDPRGLLFFFHT